MRVEQTNQLAPIIQLYREQIGARLNWSDKTFAQVRHCLEVCQDNGHLSAYRVMNQAGELIAAGCFLLGFVRVINVLGAANRKGKNAYATHYLLDYVIESHHGRHGIFDFEGSELPGVATFFKSYGAEVVMYYNFDR